MLLIKCELAFHGAYHRMVPHYLCAIGLLMQLPAAVFYAIYRDDEACNTSEELASSSCAVTGDELQLGSAAGNIENDSENSENRNNNSKLPVYCCLVA